MTLSLLLKSFFNMIYLLLHKADFWVVVTTFTYTVLYAVTKDLHHFISTHAVKLHFPVSDTQLCCFGSASLMVVYSYNLLEGTWFLRKRSNLAPPLKLRQRTKQWIIATVLWWLWCVNKYTHTIIQILCDCNQSPKFPLSIVLPISPFLSEPQQN